MSQINRQDRFLWLPGDLTVIDPITRAEFQEEDHPRDEDGKFTDKEDGTDLTISPYAIIQAAARDFGPSGAPYTKAAGLRTNQAIGNAGEAALELLVDGKKTLMVTDAGYKREIDRLADGHSFEVKVGLIGKGDRIRWEAIKDEILMREGKVITTTWVFFQNPLTGKIGPTKGLRAELIKRGIAIRIIEAPSD